MEGNDPNTELLLEKITSMEERINTLLDEKKALETKVDKVVEFNRALLQNKGTTTTHVDSKENAEKALNEFLKKKGL